jgi:biopolymer transport protein ExbB
MLAIISSSGWPIWPLLIISVLGLAILLERSWFLRRKKISPEKDLEQALTYSLKLNTPENIHEPILEEDLVKLSKSSPLGQILATGLKARQNHQGQLQCLEEMRELANPALLKLNQYLNILATIATIAPLIGLFGTVLGMIEIFASQGGSANPQQLAQGVSMALYNTAFGLLIAIPALAGWRLLRGQADDRTQELNEGARRLIKTMYP